MDNFGFRMTSQGSLKEVMELVFKHSGYNQAALGYAIREAENTDTVKMKRAKPLRLVFFKHIPSKESYIKDFIQFPFKMDAAGTADFAERWLKEAPYDREPDHDGGNKKGWTVYNEAWGHVDGQYHVFIAVTPTWAMYGK